MRGSSMQMALTASASRLQQPRICVQCAHRLSNSHRRPFSVTASRGAFGVERMPSKMMDLMSKKQQLKSQKAQLKEMKASQIPTDIGLVGEAKLFPPLTSSLSLLTSKPLKFVKLLFVRGRQGVSSFLSVYQTLEGNRKKHPLTGKKTKREPLQLNERVRIACDLHRRLNTAIPAGDTDTIGEIACKGLEDKVKGRHIVRKQASLPQETWSLIRYKGITLPKWMPWWLAKLVPFKATTVVVDYAFPLPWAKQSYIRQVVVRIKSRQAYDKGDGNGVKEKDLTEHVVIQRMVLDSQPRDWMIWGTVEPKSIKDIDELIQPAGDDKTSQDLGLVERMQLYMSKGGMNPHQ